MRISTWSIPSPSSSSSSSSSLSPITNWLPATARVLLELVRAYWVITAQSIEMCRYCKVDIGYYMLYVPQIYGVILSRRDFWFQGSSQTKQEQELLWSRRRRGVELGLGWESWIRIVSWDNPFFFQNYKSFYYNHIENFTRYAMLAWPRSTLCPPKSL